MTKKFFLIFLFFCFFSFSLVNVHAEEVLQSPKKMVVYNLSVSDELHIVPFSKSNITFYGYSFGTYQDRESIGFIYDTPLSLKNKYVDLNFVLYNDLWSDQIIPDRVVVKNNSTGSINTCKVSSSSRNFKESTLTQPSSKFNTVICDNVFLTDDEFQVYLFDNFQSSNKTLVGISRIFAKNNVNTNSNDIKNSVDKQTEEQKKTNETLKDDSIDENININQDDLTDESGLQNLLLMPLTLMNAVNSGFNSSCSTFSLGSLYGHDLSLKCFTISDVIGSNLANIIDVIISGIFIYLFSKHLRKVFDRTSNLENEEGDVI